MRIKYTGETTRIVPAIGQFEPGWEGEVEEEKAKALMSTGLFKVAKEKKGADQ